MSQKQNDKVTNNKNDNVTNNKNDKLKSNPKKREPQASSRLKISPTSVNMVSKGKLQYFFLHIGNFFLNAIFG